MTYSLYDFEFINNTLAIYNRYCDYDHDTGVESCTYTNQIEEGRISQYSLDKIEELFNGKPSQAYYWLVKIKDTGNYYPLPLLTESQKELVLHQLKQLEVTTY